MAHDEHYVYLYRTKTGTPKYVGYGRDGERPLEHPGASHNDKFRAFLDGSDYSIEIAGPFRDREEGLNVESVLISALAPEFNIAPGNSKRFRPLGVPDAYAQRPSLPPLSLSDIGRKTGGALIVYLAAGDFLSDGRRKFSMANPLDDDVLSNIRGRWDVERHRDEWLADLESSPQVLVGVHGPKVQHRFIVGATPIDSKRWFEEELRAPDIRRRWFIPLLDPLELDACHLRGRRISGASFGQFSWMLHKWIDGDGVVRHPVSRDLAVDS
ncbi:MAG: hypothetical protein QG597_2755 [Actinomycetota bacterium]|jgi:hypothetical protein|nr:hypothetical protein [Actinomycetota bacterium]